MYSNFKRLLLMVLLIASMAIVSGCQSPLGNQTPATYDSGSSSGGGGGGGCSSCG